MYQQKVLLAAICLCGAIALASSQNIDISRCTSSTRYEADRLRETIVGSTQEFTASLERLPGQAIDTSGLNSDMDRLTQSISEMADFTQGFDASRFTAAYTENFNTVTRMMMRAMRLGWANNAMDGYVKYGARLYTGYTDFMSRVLSGCLPAGQRIKLVDN